MPRCLSHLILAAVDPESLKLGAADAAPSGQQRRRRQVSGLGGGQLDGEGQPAQALTNAGDCNRLGLCARKPRLGGRGTGDEETDCLVARDLFGGPEGSASNGGTMKPLSPETRSTARLVTSSLRRGHWVGRSETSSS